MINRDISEFKFKNGFFCVTLCLAIRDIKYCCLLNTVLTGYINSNFADILIRMLGFFNPIGYHPITSIVRTIVQSHCILILINIIGTGNLDHYTFDQHY